MLASIGQSLIHLAFPHVCESCGQDLPQEEQFLCLYCHQSLPATEFHMYPNNPVEKMFWGRLPLTHATAQYYFTRRSAIQRLMHEFKYRGNTDLGLYLGRLMGTQLNASNRFRYLDGLIPLPLFPAKERKRGFNQAELLCRGMAEILQVPVLRGAVVRSSNTETQTKKNRSERWENMKDRFVLKDEKALKGKHVLLVDDVITTGATLEACGKAILALEDVRLSIATLCISSTA